MAKQIVIDANLLILLVVGVTEPTLIGRHKRTKSFDEGDFPLLTTILASYEQIVVTPHIVTEASNLISQIEEPTATRLRQTLATLLPQHDERHEDSATLSAHPAYLRLGITDAAVLTLVQKALPLITVDLQLYLAAAHISDKAFNFNHVRQGGWFNA